jgi:hypothetical protein
MWPIHEVFGWIARSPESLIKVDLLKYLPIFVLLNGDSTVTLGDYHLPATTGLWVGVSVALVLLFVWLMNRFGVVSIRQRAEGRRQWRGAATAVAAVAVVGAGWLAMNAEFFRHVTVLTQVNRWQLPYETREPRGITVRDGKVYIADYEGPTVGELDVQTGAYRLIQPHGPAGTLTYTHPGDVQFGPDGLLYVVNNGGGPDAVWGMTLDGEIRRRIALEGKADISVGLRFRPDGSIVLSDMRRARVLGYGPDGGQPIFESAGEGGKGLNNVSGIELDDAGNIYAFEMSGFRVQVLDPMGGFVRDYTLQCQPMFGVLRDGWVDLTCERGLMSIDLANEQIQPSRVEGLETATGPLLGAAYGPDGTLYIVHDDALFAYRVEH